MILAAAASGEGHYEAEGRVISGPSRCRLFGLSLIQPRAGGNTGRAGGRRGCHPDRGMRGKGATKRLRPQMMQRKNGAGRLSGPRWASRGAAPTLRIDPDKFRAAPTNGDTCVEAARGLGTQGVNRQLTKRARSPETMRDAPEKAPEPGSGPADGHSGPFQENHFPAVLAMSREFSGAGR